jgi:hypothetical protein
MNESWRRRSSARDAKGKEGAPLAVQFQASRWVDAIFHRTVRRFVACRDALPIPI